MKRLLYLFRITNLKTNQVWRSQMTKLSIFACFFLFAMQSIAQVSGSVTDSNGDPVLGASVVVKNTARGV